VILARHGLDIPRNTLAGWMIKTDELIQPLFNLLQDRLIDYPVMHCDETTVGLTPQVFLRLIIIRDRSSKNVVYNSYLRET